MPDDILNDNNGVIHQDADGENQREERDSIQSVAMEVKDQQRQRQGGRDGDGDNKRFAPTEREEDQHGNTDHRDTHVEEQLVRLFRRRLAVIARNGDLHIARKDPPLERLDLLENLFRDRNRIRPGPLGDTEGDGGLFCRRCGVPSTLAKEHVLRWLLRAVLDFRHLAQVNRLAAEDTHHHIAGVLGVGQETTGFDDSFAVVAGQPTGDDLPVCLCKHRHDFRRAEVARGKLCRVQQHPQLSPGTAND